MRHSKLPLICTLVAADMLLLGCAATRTNFQEAETLKPLLYTAILRDTCNHISLKNSMPDVVERITVYKTAFRERYTERGSVLAPASLIDGNRDTVTYKYLLGYRQDLYLVRVQAKCNKDAWFYYSVWYRPSTNTNKPGEEQVGYGKAYFGVQDDKHRTIHFTHSLLVKNCEGGHYLALKDAADFLFVVNDLEHGESPIRVNRIVVEEDNKFGGQDAFVFKVADHFPGGMRYLTFHKIGDFARPGH